MSTERAPILRAAATSVPSPSPTTTALAGGTPVFEWLHRDAEYAAKTRFGECIAHGMLTAGFISAALGTKLAPHCCVVYLSQSLRFLKPVKIGDTIKAVVQVKGAEEEKRVLTVETICYNQDGDPVVKGEAVVLLDPVRD